jgi:hypothetical protein
MRKTVIELESDVKSGLDTTAADEEAEELVPASSRAHAGFARPKDLLCLQHAQTTDPSL